MARSYHQGSFVPKRPEKYVGDLSKIFYRSSWESKFMHWADSNPSVLKWSSEETIVPYFSTVDQKAHRYFVDFAIMIKKNDGSICKYLVEIKPKAQTVPPKQGKRKTQRYLEELATYSVNQSKWAAAEAYGKKIGMEFVVLTEDHLFNK